MKQSAQGTRWIMTQEYLNVFFVEDNSVLSLWLNTFLKTIESVRIVGSASTGLAAIEQIMALQPDLALVDIGLPDISGIQVTRKIKADLPSLKVIILTVSHDLKDISGALDAGADGYVLKSNGSPQLPQAIKSVRHGSVFLDPAIAQLMLLNNTQHMKRQGSTRNTLTNIEIKKLTAVAASDCQGGMCLVDASFVEKLKRLHSFVHDTDK